jgi:hypothetical protein
MFLKCTNSMKMSTLPLLPRATWPVQSPRQLDPATGHLTSSKPAPARPCHGPLDQFKARASSTLPRVTWPVQSPRQLDPKLASHDNPCFFSLKCGVDAVLGLEVISKWREQCNGKWHWKGLTRINLSTNIPSRRVILLAAWQIHGIMDIKWPVISQQIILFPIFRTAWSGHVAAISPIKCHSFCYVYKCCL